MNNTGVTAPMLGIRPSIGGSFMELRNVVPERGKQHVVIALRIETPARPGVSDHAGILTSELQSASVAFVKAIPESDAGLPEAFRVSATL